MTLRYYYLSIFNISKRKKNTNKTYCEALRKQVIIANLAVDHQCVHLQKDPAPLACILSLQVLEISKEVTTHPLALVYLNKTSVVPFILTTVCEAI